MAGFFFHTHHITHLLPITKYASLYILYILYIIIKHLYITTSHPKANNTNNHSKQKRQTHNKDNIFLLSII